MNEKYKPYLIYIGVALLVFGAGFWLRGYLYNDAGTIQRMGVALGEADANNKRITAERDKLQQLNLGLTDENNRSKQISEQLRKYSEELAVQLGEVRDYVAGIERNNRANEAGLAESAEINRRTGNLIGEVEKTAK